MTGNGGHDFKANRSLLWYHCVSSAVVLASAADAAAVTILIQGGVQSDLNLEFSGIKTQLSAELV